MTPWPLTRALQYLDELQQMAWKNMEKTKRGDIQLLTPLLLLQTLRRYRFKGNKK